jgi:DNA primase
LQLYGRKIGTHLVAGTQLHTWLHGPQPLFNAGTMLTNTEVVLAGSVLDGLSLWSAGFRHVVAVGGPDAFERAHLEALMLHGVTRVLFGFRRDDAGHQSGELIAKRLLSAGIECFRIEWPSGMDANDTVRIGEPDGRVRQGDSLGGVDGQRPRTQAPQATVAEGGGRQ